VRAFVCLRGQSAQTSFNAEARVGKNVSIIART
jgi:hypothetical protein